jgi:hypothetical protein
MVGSCTQTCVVADADCPFASVTVKVKVSNPRSSVCIVTTVVANVVASCDHLKARGETPPLALPLSVTAASPTLFEIRTWSGPAPTTNGGVKASTVYIDWYAWVIPLFPPTA